MLTDLKTLAKTVLRVPSLAGAMALPFLPLPSFRSRSASQVPQFSFSGPHHTTVDPAALAEPIERRLGFTVIDGVGHGTGSRLRNPQPPKLVHSVEQPSNEPEWMQLLRKRVEVAYPESFNGSFRFWTP